MERKMYQDQKSWIGASRIHQGLVKENGKKKCTPSCESDFEFVLRRCSLCLPSAAKVHFMRQSMIHMAALLMSLRQSDLHLQTSTSTDLHCEAPPQPGAETLTKSFKIKFYIYFLFKISMIYFGYSVSQEVMGQLK